MIKCSEILRTQIRTIETSGIISTPHMDYYDRDQEDLNDLEIIDFLLNHTEPSINEENTLVGSESDSEEENLDINWLDDPIDQLGRNHFNLIRCGSHTLQLSITDILKRPENRLKLVFT